MPFKIVVRQSGRLHQIFLHQILMTLDRAVEAGHPLGLASIRTEIFAPARSRH
jgi:hypothetical protein